MNRESPLIAIKNALPGPLVNGLLFVAPAWVTFPDLLVASGLSLVVLGWVGAELLWAN